MRRVQKKTIKKGRKGRRITIRKGGINFNLADTFHNIANRFGFNNNNNNNDTSKIYGSDEFHDDTNFRHDDSTTTTTFITHKFNGVKYKTTYHIP